MIPPLSVDHREDVGTGSHTLEFRRRNGIPLPEACSRGGPIKGADAEWLSFVCVSTEASVYMSVRFPESSSESMILQFLHPEPTAQHPKSNMRIERLQDDKGGWAGDRRDWVL
ncbi:hypothetical protein CSPX01_03299 [Colletotrichum filicis]|nr:hypothetical protein CSPX01_03299 [Colletotrichum filicis]